MKDQSRFDIRLMLAKGHWTLGEYDFALRCIEASFEETGDVGQVSELLQTFQSELSDGPPNADAQAKLDEWFEQFNGTSMASISTPVAESPVLATPTIAHLMAKQGHHDEALEIAESVLRRNPADEQAIAVLDEIAAERAPSGGDTDSLHLIMELERWLANATQLRASNGVRT